jgi:HPt (histidine-containing phosphotransfer) domain-containing protein
MTPAASDDETAIDLVRLSEILGEDDPDEIRAHLDLFFSHFPALIDRLEVALTAMDRDAVGIAAHTATGAAGMAGATPLQDVLRRIETAARAGDTLDAASAMSQIRSEYARVQAFVADGGLAEGSH